MTMPDEGRPPFFSTWGKLYTAIAAYLVTLIVLFYLFTRAFR